MTAPAGRGSFLLVDDDDDFRRVLASELSRRGYAVTTAATGAAAVEEAPHTEAFFFGKLYVEEVPGLTQAQRDAESIEIIEKAFKWMDEPEKHVSRDVIYQASW